MNIQKNVISQEA